MQQPPLTRRAARRGRRASRATRMMQAALGAVLMTVLGILAGGGTYALWSAVASTGSQATLTAGTAELSLSGNAPSATGLYPGRTAYAVTTVRNTGTTPLRLSLTAGAASTDLGRALAVTAAPLPSGSSCAAGLPGGPGSVALGSATDLGITLAPGATTQLCLGVGLPTAAPVTAAGGTASVSFTVTGIQVLS